MRILIYSLNYAPELTGIGKYSGEMAEWLAAHGHDVRVIAAPPYYPAWQVADGYRAARYSVEEINGVDVYRCPMYVPKKVRALSRIFHLLSFAITSFPIAMQHALFWRPSIIFVVQPPIFCAPTAWLASKLSGATSWMHVQDFEIDAAFNFGFFNSTVARGFMAYHEKWLMRLFDRVSTISNGMRESLLNKGVDAKNIRMVPNWVDVTSIKPLDRPSRLRHVLAISADKIVVLYSGNMGKKQGLELLVEVAFLMSSKPELLFVFCGDGSERLAIEKRCACLRNVLFVPLQPLDNLNELMNLADIHVLPQRAGAETAVMPSKLSTMLASGKPIVATASVGSEVAKIVENCGLRVNYGDTVAMAKAIANLADHPVMRAAFGAQARLYATQYLHRDKILASAFEEYGENKPLKEASLSQISASE